jgi:chromosomal replication initiation ATPase DnaA
MNNTFESITITKENEFAYYAPLDVAIGTLLNPLVICGRREDTTLLLQAIRNKMIQNSLRTSVVLTEASSLMKAVDC